MDQYAGSAGHGTYCYAELAVSSLAVAETIATTHCAYPRKDVRASLIIFLYYCSPSSGFYGAGGRRTDNPSGRHPVRTVHAAISIIPHFYAEYPFFCNTPNLS